MATETETVSTVEASENVEASDQEIDTSDGLALALEKLETKPLWTQMTKLNPPLPNPSCVPHVWRYDQIRPSLLKAGELVNESQAERRVLMLVNPARGRMPHRNLRFGVDLIPSRRSLHNRHTIRRPATGDAQ
jgi:gentisate 1,2-dioxygenase